MSWLDEALNLLDAEAPWGYRLSSTPFAEPTALAALALGAHERSRNHHEALHWLANLQAADGSVGVSATHPEPGWPTSLAVLAWQAARTSGAGEPESAFGTAIERAVQWILTTKGICYPRVPEMGHDTSLLGWPWVQGTHSWVEPTAMHLLALKATGFGNHIRARKAVRLLVDRLLAGGGCNYGNTTVLGQELLPHLAPTGIALLALAGEADSTGRIRNSLHYLQRELFAQRGTASLCYGLMALTAYGYSPPDADRHLARAFDRNARRGPRPLELALLCLAALGSANPLIALGKKVSSKP
jgi:hypothetical protein